MPNNDLPENWRRTSNCTYEYTLNGQTIADVQESGQGYHILHIRIKPKNGMDRSWSIEDSAGITALTTKDLLDHATRTIQCRIRNAVDQLGALLPDPVEDEIRLHAASMLSTRPGVIDKLTYAMYKEMARLFKQNHTNVLSDDTQYDDVVWSYVTKHGLLD